MVTDWSLHLRNLQSTTSNMMTFLSRKWAETFAPQTGKPQPPKRRVSPRLVSRSGPAGEMDCCHWHLSKTYLMSKTNWTRWPHSRLLQHALMKSPRRAELPCTRAHSAWICVRTSVNQHRYPVANCFLLTLAS